LTNRSVTRLANGNVTRSTNVNLSSLTNGNIPNMTDANCTKLFVSGSHGSSKTTVCVHGMLMLLHDSMPSFMNFRRVLDLLEFKNQVSQCLRPSDGGSVFDIHSHFLHGT